MRKILLKPADYLIIAALLLAGLAGLWYNLQAGGRFQPKYAIVYVDNQQVAELSLSEKERFLYAISFGNEGQHHAVLELEEGRVRMLPMGQALCPKGICSHTGWITYPYESIVCLPNRIMVVFSAAPGARDNDIDGITF